MNEPTNETSETPRTDAEESVTMPTMRMVRGDFARQLERELAAANEVINARISPAELAILRSQLAAVTKRRDQAAAARDGYKETIRLIIEALEWDGLDGIPAVVKKLRLENEQLRNELATRSEDTTRILKLDAMLNESCGLDPVELFMEDGGVIVRPPAAYAAKAGMEEVAIGENTRAALDAVKEAK